MTLPIFFIYFLFGQKRPKMPKEGSILSEMAKRCVHRRYSNKTMYEVCKQGQWKKKLIIPRRRTRRTRLTTSWPSGGRQKWVCDHTWNSFPQYLQNLEMWHLLWDFKAWAFLKVLAQTSQESSESTAADPDNSDAPHLVNSSSLLSTFL